MKISVIIAYYRKLSNLKLILSALNNQTYTDFEVIIAEDDNNPVTDSFLFNNKNKYPYTIIHLNQEVKQGFYKNTMLNKAICKSNGDILVFIDGDCIPHKNFLKEYNKNAKNGEYLSGRRVLLGKKISKKILTSQSLLLLRFLSVLFSDSRLKKEGIYWPFFRLYFKKRKLSGCNWGIYKTDILKVNGFDEDYIKPGVGEDFDIEWRLNALGLNKKSMKNKAIIYHLFHDKIGSQDDADYNYSLLVKKKQLKKIKCINGIEKLDNMSL